MGTVHRSNRNDINWLTDGPLARPRNASATATFGATYVVSAANPR